MALDVMEQMRGAFRAEALDLLIELDSALLSLEEEPGDSTLVNRVFRAIHTIKGSGATAGFAHLARFAHKMEEAFDLAREGRLTVSPDLIDCGLKACDVLRTIIDEKAEGPDVPGEIEATAAFIRQLPASGPPQAHQGSHPAAPPDIRAAFDIVFKPNREMFYSGADPVTLLDDLRELGQAHITAHADQVPPLSSLEAEHCYLWWDIVLITSRDLAAVKDVFVFVDDECEVRVQLRGDQADAVALLGSAPESFQLFIAECEDLLQGIERDALTLEINPASKDSLNSLFRGIHSIKGNTGVILGTVEGTLTVNHPLQVLLKTAHGFESLLDACREVTAPVPPLTIQTALDSCDAIRSLLSGLTNQDAVRPISQELLRRLSVSTDPAPSPRTISGREAAYLNTTSQCIQMIEGCLEGIEAGGPRDVPLLETYLRGIKTWSAAAQYQKCPQLDEPLGQQLRILDLAIQNGATLGPDECADLSTAFLKARTALDPARSEIEQPVAVEPPAPIQASPTSPSATASATPSTIRIDQNKLDRLMRVVGELLVARGAFPMLIGKLNDGADRSLLVKDLKETSSNITRIADELQTSVMSIRMLPVKTVFQRFPRLVRDLARSLGKEVRLEIEGEGIELDKTILEQIGDPLVHLIRNAVDHGIELPEERRARGKDPSGQVTLRAVYESGGVAIEVSDDGQGLDVEALKRKAVQKGLLTPEAAAGLSEQAAFQLIFAPGLTTAAKVTDVSGRGVGMDVVRSNVRNLQGSIEIRSKLGRGSTILVRLPASLMISKGILLRAGTQEYILPLSNIRDMVKLPATEAHVYRGVTLAQVRGTTYALFSLCGVLGLTATKTPELSIAIVEAGAMKYGLVVDKFLSEVEVLVKPLTGGLERCREFQGAAIMGDGRVVLVLNALECHGLDRTDASG